MKRCILQAAIVLALFGAPVYTHAQDLIEKRDSIRASVITAGRGVRRDAGIRLVSPGDISTMVASVGEADVIKFIQTLPGISTGAEGSSAFYARGGNLGSNLQTLDGVPVYGNTHMLGMTTVYSQDIVSSAQFQIGGFTSEEGNLTSSHIKITTSDGDFNTLKAKVSASNFMVGAMVSAPLIKDKLSVLATTRISPLGFELSAVKGLTPAMDSISNISSAIYDLFVEFSYKASDRHMVSVSGFNSMDSYGYSYGRTSDDRMRWSNSIITLSDRLTLRRDWTLFSQISHNRFSNYQGMRKILSASENDMAVQSYIDETIGNLTLSGRMFNELDYQGGVKLRYASFAPASTGFYSKSVISPVDKSVSKDIVESWLTMIHSQIEWKKEDRYDIRLSGRLNKYSSTRLSGNEKTTRPWEGEFGLMSRVNLSPWMGIEATADWTRQYYHTLEGLPLGWNLDMVVPSDKTCAPEQAKQYYLGWFGSFGQHRLSLGAFAKQMYNLVYLPDASQVFSTASAGWRSGVMTGEGSSKGIELLYEKEGEKLDWKLSYTLSKTDRLFDKLNGGNPFHAQYDRRHILNYSSEYTVISTESRTIGVSGLFTYQSGHWTTVHAGNVTGLIPPFNTPHEIHYYMGLNNWEMPAYIRMDLGVFIKYGQDSIHPGQLNIGIYNLLNRHNPYSLTYDANSRKWKQVSLFPIMPSISWNVTF